MINQEQKVKKSKRLKIIIVILAALLVLSAGGLLARYVYLTYFAPTQSTAVVPDNLIGDESNQPVGNTSSYGSTESSISAGGESGSNQSTSTGGSGSNSNGSTTYENAQSSISAGGESGSNQSTNTGGSGSNSNGSTTYENAQSSVSAGGESGSNQTTSTGSSDSDSNGSATEDNPTAAVLELYRGRPGDNERFETRNMLPGDIVTQYFCVRAYHDADLTLYFQTEVTEQTKNLGDVLHIKVTRLETGEVLCDAPFNEINGKEFSELLTDNAEDETIAYYQIDVSLDTSVGNEYQAALLKADFNWYIKDDGGLTPPPQTSDNINLTLWIVLAGSSLLLLLILLLSRRRKEDEQHV